MHPAPSPAALRVLRQLAYIGSGSVAAVGVLITEEQRRRICTARRIVENKKKLQSCERWVGNRCTGTTAADGLSALSLDEPRPGNCRPEWQDTVEASAARADFLPSHVERNFRRARRRRELPLHDTRDFHAQLAVQEDDSGEAKDPELSGDRCGPEKKVPLRRCQSRISAPPQEQPVKRTMIRPVAPRLQAKPLEQQHPISTTFEPPWPGSFAQNAENAIPRSEANKPYLPLSKDAGSKDTNKWHTLYPVTASDESLVSSQTSFKVDVSAFANAPESMSAKNESKVGSRETSFEDRPLTLPNAPCDPLYENGSHSTPRETMEEDLPQNQPADPDSGNCTIALRRVRSMAASARKLEADGTAMRGANYYTGSDSHSTELCRHNRPNSVMEAKTPTEPRPRLVEDKLHHLLAIIDEPRFGIQHLSRVMNDFQCYHEIHEKINRLPEIETELRFDAKYPFGSNHLATWQRDDPVMAKKIAYHLVYQACSQLLSVDRDQEAVNLFIHTLGQNAKRATSSGNLLHLPMRLPRRWRSRGTLLRLLHVSLRLRVWSSARTSFELTVSYDGQAAALKVIQKHIRDALTEDRITEVAKILSVIPRISSWDTKEAESVVEISSEIIRTALTQGHLEVAMETFEWTEKQGFPDKGERLEPIIGRCLDHHSLSSTSPEHTSIEEQVKGTEGALPILWAISASRGFPYTATALIQHLVRAQPDWVLDKDLVTACNAVLGRVWRETSDFQLVCTLYGDFQKSSKKRGGLPVSTYNCWLMICYKSGRNEEAQRCLEEMQSDGGPGADVSSFGNIMHAEAVSGRWPAVEAMLVRLHESGQMPLFSRKCWVIFDKIFREFVKKFGIDRGWTFITKVIGEYGFEPSVRLSNTFLERCVKERQWLKITNWFRWLNSHGVEFRVNALSVLLMMDRFYQDLRPPRLEFVRMCYVLRATRKGLITHQLWRKAKDAVAYDARTRVWRRGSPDSPIFLRWKSHIEGPLAKLESDLRTLPSVWRIAPDEYGLPNSSDKKSGTSNEHDTSQKDNHPYLSGARDRPGLSPSQLDHHMVTAISLHRPAEAVELFRENLSSTGVQHSGASLSIAVDACLQANNGSREPAYNLLREAAAAGVNTTRAFEQILLHRMRKHRFDHSKPRLTKMVLRFYKSLGAIGLHTKHHLSVAAAEHLIHCGRAEGGIELLSLIYYSAYAEQVPMDIAAMSVFVKGYANIGHLQGIKWVVEKVLGENMRIELPFCLALGDARKPLRKLLETPGLSADTKQRVQEAIAQLKDWQTECQDRRHVQIARTVSDGWELVKTIQDLSTDMETNEEIEEDLGLYEIVELMARDTGIQGPLTEYAARRTYTPIEPLKAQQKASESPIDHM